MRVFVTGHRGRIGAVLVPAFQAAGHDDVGLESDRYCGFTFRDPVTLPSISDLVPGCSVELAGAFRAVGGSSTRRGSALPADRHDPAAARRRLTRARSGDRARAGRAAADA